MRILPPLVAYFSMEIGMSPLVPTYSGGLGVLAGDTIRSAADLEIPFVAVTLLHRHGYFYQRLDEQGRQLEEPVAWAIDDFVEPMDPVVHVEVEGRSVAVRAWRYRVKGESGFEVPVYLLDTDLSENNESDRKLTDNLYGGDLLYRLSQEVVLGYAGLRMLRALGYGDISRYHLNEGHAALLVLALLEEKSAGDARPVTPPHVALEAVRERCVFTTHTPVPAGHDQFPADLARRVLGERRCGLLSLCAQDHGLNMTLLALRGSRFINGVAMKHGEVSSSLFPGYPIHSITNGVHAVTWAAPAFQALYDRYLRDWRRDQLSLRYAISIPSQEIWTVHLEAKYALIEYVNRTTNAGFDRDVFTIGFARRATAYKRAGLIFHDVARLRKIAGGAAIQILFGGKAHPRDEQGKEIIRFLHGMREQLRGSIAMTYVPNYDMAMARLICAGVDLWLNTPLPPMEASGTSGMKAAVNGVPSLSVLDGWWIEGHLEDVTGWSIGDKVDSCLEPSSETDQCHADSLYGKLEQKVLPMFYHDRAKYIEVMRHSIALNGAFFNTQRMVTQYVNNAYRMVGGYAKSEL